MARQLAKLSARRAATLTEPGRHSDGGGLYLVVDESGARRWTFIYRWKQPGRVGAGRLREMGLGSFHSVSLEKARKKAAAARELLSDGKDPISAKRIANAIPTFGELADDFIDAKSKALDNDKSQARLERCLTTYAAPLRPLRVDAISTDDILQTLMARPVDDPKGEPFWLRASSSAKMARGYIEAVLEAAKARGFRNGENPARWRGHLDYLLAKPKKLTRGHHAAMRYQDVGGFVSTLRSINSTAALGLEFLILTASRSAEVLGAKWEEIDEQSNIWTVPGCRMKGRRDHRVPLSRDALDVLRRVKPLARDDGYIFPGAKDGRPLSGMVFDMILRRQKLEVTTHGFRSAFRDWAGDETDYAREISEAALAHLVGDEAERAYRRGDALEKRRRLMQDWALHCSRNTNDSKLDQNETPS